jgi:hypothetical protein
MIFFSDKWIGTTRSAIGFWDSPEAFWLFTGIILGPNPLLSRNRPCKAFFPKYLSLDFVVIRVFLHSSAAGGAGRELFGVFGFVHEEF